MAERACANRARNVRGEFPHVVPLVRETLFDTIYHEHFSYLSLTTVERVFQAQGLAVFDVQTLPTHGGSLRVFAQRGDTGVRPRTDGLSSLLAQEADAGVATPGFYAQFQARAEQIGRDFCAFVTDARRSGKRVAAYGAAAKGNTLMNYAGVGVPLISFVADRNPAKQGKYTPGGRIPIVDERVLSDERPDFVVILPWNLKNEIMAQLEYVREWNAKFVTALPELTIARRRLPSPAPPDSLDVTWPLSWSVGRHRPY